MMLVYLIAICLILYRCSWVWMLIIPRLYRVISVYDGDTFTATRLGKQVKIRLAGVDTPELKGKTKLRGQKARNVLCETLSRYVIVKPFGKSFSRIVAGVTCWPFGKCVNVVMRKRYRSKKYDKLLTRDCRDWLVSRGWI